LAAYIARRAQGEARLATAGCAGQRDQLRRGQELHDLPHLALVTDEAGAHSRDSCVRSALSLLFVSSLVHSDSTFSEVSFAVILAWRSLWLASTSPASSAQRTIWVRLLKASLERIFDTCVSTVRLLITSSSAISSLDLAWATRIATSRWRGVRSSSLLLAAAAAAPLSAVSRAKARPLLGMSHFRVKT